MNLPNKLTLFRVILVPVFVVLMLAPVPYGKYWALAVFIIASLTDWLDGYLARKNNLVTDFGKFMDPIADKLLVSSAIICLVSNGSLAAWMAIIFIGREFIISGFRLIASDKGTVIAASYWGKFKTVFEMLMVMLLILNFAGVWHILTLIVTWIALILTVVSLVDYLQKNWSVMEGQY